MPATRPAQHTAADGLRISRAALELGVSARTLRYYEELGLLVPSGRTSGGERRYTEADLEQLRRILSLKEVLGMNLEEIKSVVTVETRLTELRSSYRAHKDDPSPDAQDALRAILAEALTLREELSRHLDEKMARMDEFRLRLADEAQRCRELLAAMGDPVS
ncbi:MAG TPA: MerR family transcriptional regulator [Acidimicrobiales bacterium]|nr:MerR family transcriptional regulator [Acidimicrobiales bacterium]